MFLDRVFAAVYDRALAPSEHAGLHDMRRDLLAGTDGRVLEIGVGTGLNLDSYPDGVTELILAEPTPEMSAVLQRHVAERVPRTDVVIEDWPAEAMAGRDASVDHVVSTLVLCTVQDLDRAVNEIARVLRPDGALHLIEHIGPADGWLGTAQSVIEPAWRIAARGCHLTRDPRGALQRAGFDISGLRETTIPAPGLLRRAIAGSAIRC